MKWNTTITLTLSGAITLAAVAYLTRGEHTSAALLMRSIEATMQRARFDKQALLGHLDLALEQAKRERDPLLEGRVRVVRGQLLMDVGALERARSDFEQVAATHAGERELENLQIELERRAGDFHAGLVRANAFAASHPEDAPIQERIGELERSSGERELLLAADQTELALVPDLAQRAKSLTERSAGLAPTDPRRVSLAHDLRDAFGYAAEEVAENVLGRADRASAAFERARVAYGKSLALEFHPPALAALCGLLERQGETAAAVDLVSATLRIAAVREDPDCTIFLVRALEHLDRTRYGAQIANDWVHRKRPMQAQFFLDAARLTYRAQRYEWLLDAADQLREVAVGDQSDIALLYKGLGIVNSGNFADARQYLNTYALSDAAEPFPKARALAWRELARANKELGLPLAEREALEGAVEIDPTSDGTAWLRLAELQLASPHGGYRQPDLRFATGMSLLPARTEELLPRWKEIGELELKSIGLDLETTRANLVHDKIWAPSSEASPYELWSLSKLHLESGDVLRATEHQKRLMELVPGFVPGLDLGLDIALARGRVRDAIDSFLTRLEVGGPNERARELLRVLPEAKVTPADRLRIVRADPDVSGRLAVARTLLARGHARAAHELLDKLGLDTLGLDGQVLAARAELALDQPGQAFLRLQAIDASLYRSSEAFALWLEAALTTREFEALRERVGEYAQVGTPARERWLALAERLIAAGANEAALSLLIKLDRTNAELRGGDVLTRLAAALLERPALRDKALSTLDRAAAFDTKGEAELLTLLCAPSDQPLSTERAGVLALAAAHFEPTALGSAALALMAERDTLGSKIQDALQVEPHDPLWELLAAWIHDNAAEPLGLPASWGEKSKRDTEELLALHDPHRLARLVLALSHPLGAGWARADLAVLEGQFPDNLWCAWMRSSLARGAGNLHLERELLEGLVAKAPKFKPAWDALLRQSRARSSEGEAELALEQARVRALGSNAGTPGELQLLRARALEGAGELVEARTAAEHAVEHDPRSALARRHLAVLCARTGDLPRALTAYRRALEGLPGHAGDRAAGEYLALIEHPDPNLLAPDGLRAELERLAKTRPDDPRVTLALARLDAAGDPRNPAFAVGRAYGRLELFQRAHAEQGLEILAEGSLQAWTDFLVRLDPARARALLQRELEREPGDLEAWRMSARVEREAGDDKEALAQILLLQHLDPDADVMREYLRLRMSSDWNGEGVQALVDQIARLEGGQPDPVTLALAVEANFNIGPRGAPRAVELGREIDPALLSDDAREHMQRSRLFALIARGTEAELSEARELLEIYAPLGHAYGRDALIDAARGMLRAIRPAAGS